MHLKAADSSLEEQKILAIAASQVSHAWKISPLRWNVSRSRWAKLFQKPTPEYVFYFSFSQKKLEKFMHELIMNPLMLRVNIFCTPVPTTKAARKEKKILTR